MTYQASRYSGSCRAVAENSPRVQAEASRQMSRAK